jgi:hypothetical protein
MHFLWINTLAYPSTTLATKKNIFLDPIHGKLTEGEGSVLSTSSLRLLVLKKR